MPPPDGVVLEVEFTDSGHVRTFAFDPSSRLGATGAASPLADEAPSETASQDVPSELERVVFRIHSGSSGDFESWSYRVRLGSVVVASSAPEGPDEEPLVAIAPGELTTRTFQPFLDCAGSALLEVSVRSPTEDDYQATLLVPLRILPAKITPDELRLLIEELEEAAYGILFDAYAKTLARPGKRPRDLHRTPFEKLEQVRRTIDAFGAELARISRRPAQRLTLSPRRVAVLPGDPITPETLVSIAEDASLLARSRHGVFPRERIEMTAEKDVRLAEHLALAGFLGSLAEELRDALVLIRKEIQTRMDRRQAFAAGSTGIWGRREEPRIRAFMSLEATARNLLAACRDLRRRHDFLPADVPPLRRAPEITKRFAHVGAYRELYRLMQEHFAESDLLLEGWRTPWGAKSLPVLWEYWIVLRILQFLQKRLPYGSSPWESSDSLFRRLVGARDRYVFDLAGNQRLEFMDSEGSRILFRYQPRYSTMAGVRARRGRSFGRLQRRGAPYEPDVAIEIYPVEAEESGVPRQILLFDAKYSSRNHEDILASILRYRNIGDHATGRRLARHVWAVTNSLLPGGSAESPTGQLDTLATVDNEAFFLDTFSPQSEVCGVVGVRPGVHKERDALELLLARVFDVVGVV